MRNLTDRKKSTRD